MAANEAVLLGIDIEGHIHIYTDIYRPVGALSIILVGVDGDTFTGWLLSTLAS